MKRFMVFFTLALLAMFAHPVYTQLLLYNDLTREEAALAAELEKENETLERLKKEKEHYMSDAYVQKIAREELGLVYQDEIVFKNENTK